MEQQEKQIPTILFLSLLTLIFLLTSLWIARDSKPQTDYYAVSTECEAADGGGEVVPERININTASAEELEKLTGIGPALAETIIAYREEYGAFSASEELLQVKGIGEKKLAGFRDEITLGEEENENTGR